MGAVSSGMSSGPWPLDALTSRVETARTNHREFRASQRLENIQHTHAMERDALAQQHHIQNTVMGGYVQYALNDQAHKHTQAETRLSHKNTLGVMDAYVGHVKDLSGGRPVGNASFPSGGSVSFDSPKPKKKKKSGKSPSQGTPKAPSGPQSSPGRGLNPVQFSHAEGAYNPQGPTS